MSELLTQSRPYAEAIFEIAKEENALDLWVSDLTLVAISMQEVEVKRLIDSPDISQTLNILGRIESLDRMYFAAENLRS